MPHVEYTHSTEKAHDTTLYDEKYYMHYSEGAWDMMSVVVMTLCHQPDAFASDLGDDQSRYLFAGWGGFVNKANGSGRLHCCAGELILTCCPCPYITMGVGETPPLCHQLCHHACCTGTYSNTRDVKLRFFHSWWSFVHHHSGNGNIMQSNISTPRKRYWGVQVIWHSMKLYRYYTWKLQTLFNALRDEGACTAFSYAIVHCYNDHDQSSS